MRKQVRQAEVDMHRFSLYAAENLRMYDDLKKAKELLDRAGIDSSFIRLAPLYKA